MVKLFKTKVSGIGPFCVEFDDGEIVHTRSEKRQALIANSETLLNALRDILSVIRHSESFSGVGPDYLECVKEARRAVKISGGESL